MQACKHGMLHTFRTLLHALLKYVPDESGYLMKVGRSARKTRLQIYITNGHTPKGIKLNIAWNI